MLTYHLEICNQQKDLPIDETLWKKTVRMIFRDAVSETSEASRTPAVSREANALPPRAVISPHHWKKVSLSIAVVDDLTSHQVNVDFLGHDFPTDVISFPLQDDATCFQGELVVNAPFAVRSAKEYGWDARNELLLYVIHGSLHLTGYDDLAEYNEKQMRLAERFYLRRLKITIPPTMPQSADYQGQP
ncbi:MAG: rRNA maturation RNase YbeY [Thermoguttaceae bacterium]|nr:rRNA maturation RNase YbeY [Thermoguttaceae bacterium]